MREREVQEAAPPAGGAGVSPENLPSLDAGKTRRTERNTKWQNSIMAGRRLWRA